MVAKCEFRVDFEDSYPSSKHLLCTTNLSFGKLVRTWRQKRVISAFLAFLNFYFIGLRVKSFDGMRHTPVCYVRTKGKGRLCCSQLPECIIASFACLMTLPNKAIDICYASSPSGKTCQLLLNAMNQLRLRKLQKW